jgi:NADH-quinone oxidoreductase subunit N
MGLGVLLADLWLPADARRKLGYAAAACLFALFLYGFRAMIIEPVHATAFPIGASKSGMFIQDGLALYFKQFFLLAGAIVMLISVEYSGRFQAGVSEFFSLSLFALLGMVLAASANDFVLMFAALELITITFVVLNSFQRNRIASLEAGVKYLIIGAMASAFMVFGIALVFGSAGTTNFDEIRALQKTLATTPVFMVGLLLVLVTGSRDCVSCRGIKSCRCGFVDASVVRRGAFHRFAEQ